MTILHGLAAVVGKLSVDRGGYREIFRDGVFLDSIRDDNVVAEIEHDKKRAFASCAGGNLILRESAGQGLYFQAQPNFLPAAKDAIDGVRSGKFSKMSVGYYVFDDYWHRCALLVRAITRARLFELSLVGTPAFVDTDVRCLEVAAETESTEYRRTNTRYFVPILPKLCEAADGYQKGRFDFCGYRKLLRDEIGEHGPRNFKFTDTPDGAREAEQALLDCGYINNLGGLATP